MKLTAILLNLIYQEVGLLLKTTFNRDDIFHFVAVLQLIDINVLIFDRGTQHSRLFPKMIPLISLIA